MSEILGETNETTHEAGQADTARGETSAEQTTTPFDGVDDEIRAWLEKKGLRDVGALAKSYRELEQLRGRSITLPGDDASEEDWGRTFDRLGRPKTPGGYERPEFVQDDAFWNDVASMMHGAGLTTRQAAAFSEGWKGLAEKASAAAEAKAAEEQAAFDAQLEEATAKLKAELGDRFEEFKQRRAAGAAALGLSNDEVFALARSLDNGAERVARMLADYGATVGGSDARGGTPYGANGSAPPPAVWTEEHDALWREQLQAMTRRR